MKQILCILIALFLMSCKTIEPFYSSGLVNVGYKEKLNYWEPVRAIPLSSTAERIRQKLYRNNAILFYSYKIDSNGVVRELILDKTIPANLITTKELNVSMLVYSKFKPSNLNIESTPVFVNERIVFRADGNTLAIPPDEMSDEEVIEAFN